MGVKDSTNFMAGEKDKTPQGKKSDSSDQTKVVAKRAVQRPKRSTAARVGKGVVVIVGLATVGVFLYRVSQPLLLSLARRIVQRETAGEEETRGPSEVAVEAERVETKAMPRVINTVGELRANAAVVIHSEINGRVKEICFTEGTEVKEGDLLLKFDDEQFLAEVQSCEAQYQAARAEYERFEKMRASGAGSGKDYDKAKAEVNVTRAKLQSAQAQLKKTEIRAPFSGVIGLIDISPGSYVQPNQEIVTLVDQTPIKVRFGIPGKFVNDVGIGQTVELRVDACKDRVFYGLVEAVDSHVDPSTNSVSVRASIPNEDGTLKSGLFASVSLVVGEQNAITVDEAAVERMGEQEYVWVVERGKARRVGVLTGARAHGRVEVVGLREGQIVVVAGQLRLTEGRWVRVTNMELEKSEMAPESDGVVRSDKKDEKKENKLSKGKDKKNENKERKEEDDYSNKEAGGSGEDGAQPLDSPQQSIPGQVAKSKGAGAHL